MLYVKRSIVEDSLYDSETIGAYVALRSIYNNSRDIVYITINSLCYELLGSLKKNRSISEALTRGLTKLINTSLVKIIEEKGREYVLDLSGLHIDNVKSGDGKKEYYVAIEEKEVYTIFNSTGKEDKFSMLRLLIVMFGSIDFNASVSDQNDRMCIKTNFVGYMPQSYLASKAHISKGSCIAYIDKLEKLEVIYVYRHKVHLNNNNNIARKNNNYGRFKDTDLIKQYATNICDYYAELDSELVAKERKANKGRSLMQKYNCLYNGINYDEKIKKEIYDYVHSKNVLLLEMIDKCDNENLKEKLKCQLKDESMFKTESWIIHSA